MLDIAGVMQAADRALARGKTIRSWLDRSSVAAMEYCLVRSRDQSY
jgi:hypothetical protein